MASSDSHCQMVEPEMADHRGETVDDLGLDVGNLEAGEWQPELRQGSSHAIALTAMTDSGGKKPAPAGPVALLQALQALLEEPFAPFADDLAAGVEALGDLVVAQAAGQQRSTSWRRSTHRDTATYIFELVLPGCDVHHHSR